jgi:putative inorganic carbon (HCO3(-)) transporter
MPAKPPIQTAAAPGNKALVVFSALFGGLLGLALLKFGNPVILDKLVEAPHDAFEGLLVAWPISWAYPLLGIVAIVGLLAIPRERPRFDWVAALPLAWLGWQLIAATRTVDAELTGWTLKHFGGCVVCFYLGFYCLSRAKDVPPFFWLLLAGFVLVLCFGWEQRFGGLAETRKHFEIYIYPTLKDPSPEFLKRMRSDRIFSTLFYANTLAGAILLLLPALLAFLWQCQARFTLGARIFLMGSLGVAALACLFWTGSKGGWLLMLALGLVALLHLRFPPKWKAALVAAVLLVGLTGFAIRYAGYFKRGATSVGARIDYWEAAVKTAAAHPIVGTGPGTFGISYQKLRRPESEPSRMTHNDYLQQACDSGWPGVLPYAALVFMALLRGYPRTSGSPDWRRLAIWLGLLGWGLQGLFEFSLYIPALAWPAFMFMGWLLGFAGLPSTTAVAKPSLRPE